MTSVSLGNGAKDKRGGSEKPRLNPCDRGVVTTTVLLMAFGLVTLYAASYYNAQDASGSPLAEVVSQLMGIALGAVVMAFTLRIDYRILQKPIYSSSLLCVSLLLLVLVLSLIHI